MGKYFLAWDSFDPGISDWVTSTVWDMRMKVRIPSIRTLVLGVIVARSNVGISVFSSDNKGMIEASFFGQLQLELRLVGCSPLGI